MTIKVKAIISAGLTVLIAGGLSQGAGQTRNSRKTAKAPVTIQQRKTVESIVRNYLLKHPELIREMMSALDAKEASMAHDRAAASLRNFKSEIYSDSDSPVSGNPNGDVSVVVFYDYFCGYCRKSLPDLQTLVAKDNSVRVIFKEFPILGPQSTVAAEAALAARRQGKFDAFHQAMLESKSASDEAIAAIAEKLGLDREKLFADMKDPVITAAIQRNMRLAAALHIEGTPAYLIGDRFIPGAIDLEDLSKIVEQEHARSARTVTRP
jgi:protein-disulfide isomerase